MISSEDDELSSSEGDEREEEEETKVEKDDVDKLSVRSNCSFHITIIMYLYV